MIKKHITLTFKFYNNATNNATTMPQQCLLYTKAKTCNETQDQLLKRITNKITEKQNDTSINLSLKMKQKKLFPKWKHKNPQGLMEFLLNSTKNIITF